PNSGVAWALKRPGREGVHLNRTKQAWLFMGLTATVPILGTTLSMVWFPGEAWAKVAFGLAKIWILLAPLLWLWKVERVRLRIPRWSNRGMGLAHGTGVLIFAVIAGTYYGLAHAWIDPAVMLEKVRQFGLDRLSLYLLGALYWCTINSLLEEYFWRWFVYERLRDVLPRSAAGIGSAVVACGLLFTAHHVVALSVYFDARTTALASLGVFVGGVTWSWLYAKSGNIYAAYVSHVWADIIIFWIGWQLIFG
ncbi:MAG: type II CAAX endopeptidase family protein, partial [Planctomycetota bacterium]